LIDFRPIAGSNKKRPLTFWVRLLGYEDVRNSGTPPPPLGNSLLVKVNFVGSGPTTIFTFEGLRPELAYSMPIAVRLFTLAATGDNDIEPYLLVAIVYADGTTIVPELDLAEKKLRFANSTVRLTSGAGTHGNILGDGDMDSGEIVQIPGQVGHFDNIIRPIGLQLAEQYGRPESEKQNLRENTQVGIVIVGMEEDAIPSTETANEVYGEFIAALQESLDKLVRGVVLNATNPTYPDLTQAVEELKGKIRERLQAYAEARTIAELEGYLAIPGAPMLATFGAANADDYIGTGVKVVTYQELLNAAENGIGFTLELSDNPDEEVAYLISGKIYIR
jgi:hypothetical protein